MPQVVVSLSGGWVEVPVVGSVTLTARLSQPLLAPESWLATDGGVVRTAVAEPVANVVGVPPLTDTVQTRLAALEGELTSAWKSTGWSTPTRLLSPAGSKIEIGIVLSLGLEVVLSGRELRQYKLPMPEGSEEKRCRNNC
jgi:hypothetical protein